MDKNVLCVWIFLKVCVGAVRVFVVASGSATLCSRFQNWNNSAASMSLNVIDCHRCHVDDGGGAAGDGDGDADVEVDVDVDDDVDADVDVDVYDDDDGSGIDGDGDADSDGDVDVHLDGDDDGDDASF